MSPPAQPALLAGGGGVAEDVGQLTRVGVEQRDARAREVAHAAHAGAGHDLAAELLEERDHRAPDGLRTAAGDGPAAGMPCCDEQGRDAGRARRVERRDGMCGRTGEQRRTRAVHAAREP